MRKRDNQIIFVGFILALLTTSLLGCKNSGGAKEEKSRTEIVEQKKPIIMKESFHKFRESMDGKISPQWLLSDSLSKYATIEEIEKLATTDKDPIKRLVAFRALLTKDPHQAVNLAISNIEDTTIVATTDGDCGEEDRVSNVRICMLQYHRERNHITYNLNTKLVYANYTSKTHGRWWLWQDITERTKNRKLSNCSQKQKTRIPGIIVTP